MEIAREKVIPLIRGYNYRIPDIKGFDEIIFAFHADDVNLAEEMKADPSCLKTKAIAEYFQSQKQYHFLTYGFNYDCDDEYYLELTKDFVSEALRLQPDSFIQIQISESMKSKCNQERILLEQRFKLLDLMTSTYNRLLYKPNDQNFRQDISFENGINGKLLVLRFSLGWEEAVKIQLLEPQSILGKMLENESTMDLTIVAGNGAEVKCHLPVFAAHAPAFSAMVSAESGMKEAESKRVELKENSEVGLRQLVRYLYGVELSVGEMGSDTALELFQVAHKYGLSQLETSLGQLFLCMKNMEWFTPDVVLELYLFVKNVDDLEKLKERSLVLMASIPADELRSCELFKELDKAESAHLSRKLGHNVKPTQRRKRARLN